MSEKRKDNKGRILRNGELQLSDGRYRFKWRDVFGEERMVYSWRLEDHDNLPKGKKKAPSLRELEKQIQKDIDNEIASFGKRMRVVELCAKYVDIRTGVRYNTRRNYNVALKMLEKDPFGAKRIDTVKMTDAKAFLIKLHREYHRKFNTIHGIRSVLKMAFQLAVDDNLILKNPFSFPLSDVVANDCVNRQAVSPADEKKFLSFMSGNTYYKKNYEPAYILFHTGLRISEFCGLTLNDIDFKHHSIYVDKQLQRDNQGKYYIEKTKTKNGTRRLPITPDVEECFRRLIERREAEIEPCVDGYTGFLCLNRNGKPIHAREWDARFQRMRNRYNKTHKVRIPEITPHVCRHTYCTNMAMSGMNPKTLQYLMGHSEISTTLDVYTHFYTFFGLKYTKIYQNRPKNEVEKTQ
ncbi:MAG: site-specific integrase [Lachnospiraceae bacterium]|nr:site-specific integrase [Lachnospiraceae bacterium]